MSANITTMTNVFTPPFTSTMTSLTGNNTVSPVTESTASLVIRMTLIGCIFLLTILGNSLAIYVISKNKAIRSGKNFYYGYYLLNLSSSDLLVAIFCIPFTVIYYRTQTWHFGLAFCKVMPTLTVMSVSASITTLTVITLERYKAIVTPMKPRSTLIRTKISLVCIWIWALLVSVPTFISYEVDPTAKRFQCRPVWVPKYRQAYTIGLFLVDYFIPLVLIGLAYTKITYEMSSKSVMVASMGYKKLHKRFMRLMIILVISFFVCFMPNNILYFILDFGTVHDQDAFDMANNYSHILVWLNSCLNPFIYGTLDTYVKRGCKKAVGMNSVDSLTVQNTKYVTELHDHSPIGSGTVLVCTPNNHNTAGEHENEEYENEEHEVNNTYKVNGYLAVKPEQLSTFARNNNDPLDGSMDLDSAVFPHCNTIDAGGERETIL